MEAVVCETIEQLGDVADNNHMKAVAVKGVRIEGHLRGGLRTHGWRQRGVEDLAVSPLEAAQLAW